MPRGRPPKPDNVHQLHGTRSEVKKVEGHESPEPEAVVDMPPVPHTLTSDLVQRKWIEKAEQLIKAKVLKTTDLESLESFCLSYGNMCEAQAEINRDGLTIPNAQGVPMKHPAVTALKDAQSELRQMSNLLGLNPSARTRINVADKEKEKPQGLGSLQKPRRG